MLITSGHLQEIVTDQTLVITSGHLSHSSDYLW